MLIQILALSHLLENELKIHDNIKNIFLNVE